MIDNSLLKTNFLGRDGFVWWIGKVAPAKYWKQAASDLEAGWAYRCKVRIIGYHPFDESMLEDKDLPWAHVMVDATSGSGQACFGESTRMVGGETVFGFFMDGEEGQQPVVFGALARTVSEDGPSNAPTNVLNLRGSSKGVEANAFATRSGRDAGGSGPTNIPPTKGGTSVTDRVHPPQSARNDSGTPTGNEAAKHGELDGDMSKEGLRRHTASDDGTVDGDNDQGPHTGPNVCENDAISKITHAIGSFVKTVNSLTQFGEAYIDAARNMVADIKKLINKVSRMILGAIKQIIRMIRDKVMKFLGKIFRNLVGLIVPEPQKSPIIQAFKRIMDLIFCLFEKAGFDILGFIKGLLKDLIGNTINATVCAIEQAVAAILGKLFDAITSALKPILDGLDWLTGMLNNVSGLFMKISSYMNMIMSFLSCDSLQCKAYDDWSQGMGLSTKNAGSMKSVLDNIQILDDLDYAAGDGSLSFLSMMGGDFSQWFDCNEKTNNPQTQDDLSNSIPDGFVYGKCIPPKVEVFGDNVKPAQLLPIISSEDGSILTLVIIQPGYGYEVPPRISIIDKTNHGGGAVARAVINDKGEITQTYMLNSGDGYCPTTGVVPPKYPVTEGPDHEGDDPPPFITFTTPADNAVGVQTSVSISMTFSEPVIKGAGDITIIESATNQTHEMIPVGDKRITFLSDRIIKVDPNLDLKHNTEYYVKMTEGSLRDYAGQSFSGIAKTDTYNFTTRGVAGIGSEPVGIVTTLIPHKPGIGYTSGDIGQVGQCSFELVLTAAGSIVGIKNIICKDKHKVKPTVNILTNTGIGAELIPVISYSPDFVQDIGERPDRVDSDGNPITGADGRPLVVDVIDCVGKPLTRE